MFQDVNGMVFIGFGFLMTFLRRYRYAAVTYTYFISALVLQWTILVIGFWHKVYDGHWGKLSLNIVHLIEGLFGTGAVLISFGAWLGKVTPGQLLFMAFFEVIAYGVNYYVCLLVLRSIDMGGSVIIHTFGAYYGISGTYWLSKKFLLKNDKSLQASSYSSDTFSIIGTIFLWMLWPSFNAALAPSGSQFRVIINSVLSLSASCVVTFILSNWLHKKFHMEDIQNATLAGGVAIGSSSDLVIGPGGASLIGLIAGIISVLGYKFLTPFLEKRLKLHDTCGVNNLHGMPGILGGLAGTISTALASTTVYGQSYDTIFHFPAHTQWKYQLAMIGVTLGISLGSGFLFGLIANYLPCLNKVKKDLHDPEYFHAPEDLDVVTLKEDGKDDSAQELSGEDKSKSSEAGAARSASSKKSGSKKSGGASAEGSSSQSAKGSSGSNTSASSPNSDDD
jgi:ammonium transporter Rh